MSTAIESRLMSHAYGLETLKAEFVEIINTDKPEIDRALDATILLGQAIEQFEQFIGLTKRDVADLVPDPKDEVIISRARIVHRIVAAKKLDKDRWAEDVAKDETLASIEATYLAAKAAFDKAQAKYKLPSTWIEIKAAKS